MTTPDPHLTPDAVDELLSAELDGELAAAAADLGLTEGQARRALAGDPGAQARRRELRAARDLSAIAPPLGPEDLDRLVTAATTAAAGARAAPVATLSSHARGSRAARRRALVLSGSVAAAVLAVVAGVAALHTSTDTGRTSAAAKSATAATSAAPAPAAEHGNTYSALRRSLRDRLAARGVSSASYGATLDAPSQLSGAPSGHETKAADSEAQAPAAGACTGAVRARFAVAGNPVLAGLATYRGRATAVLVYAAGGRYTAYVLDRSDCSTVAVLPLG